MEGPVKTVCFISTFVITWGLFQVGEAIIAWLEHLEVLVFWSSLISTYDTQRFDEFKVRILAE